MCVYVWTEDGIWNELALAHKLLEACINDFFFLSL